MFEALEEFYQATSLEDAVKKLKEMDEEGAIIAGGTEVVRLAPNSVKCLIDISKINLGYIKFEDETLHIGSTTTISKIAEDENIQKFAGGIISKVAKSFTSKQIRNKATIGGALMTSYNPSDFAPLLLVLDANVVIVGDTRRVISIQDFLKEGKRAIHNEIIVEFMIPKPRPNTKVEFLKLGRSSFDLSIVNVATLLSLEGTRCLDARIVVGGVAPIPIRIKRAEDILINQRIDEESIARASHTVEEEVKPPSSLRGSSDYKKRMSKVLTKRALKACLI